VVHHSGHLEKLDHFPPELWTRSHRNRGPLPTGITGPIAPESAEIFDLARAHQFAIARRLGKWEILELAKLNERVEQQVRERMTALAAANQERRRLARELHDNTAELLAGLSMNLAG
jgi:signal transduction histidine kinase